MHADAHKVAQDKISVRRSVRARRRERTDAERDADAADLLRVGSEIEALRSATAVAGYLALPGEPDPAPLLDWLDSRGIRVWLPVIATATDGTPALHWADRTSGVHLGQPATSGLRLLEPVGPAHLDPGPFSVVLVPGLAVDRHGARLGQGGGYYDRTAERLGWRLDPATRPLLVAVVHSDEVLAAVPAEPFDLRADAILTPTGWISCSAARE